MKLGLPYVLFFPTQKFPSWQIFKLIEISKFLLFIAFLKLLPILIALKIKLFNTL